MSVSAFFQRFRLGAGARPGARPAVSTPADVEAARVQARRRLIGMLVLVVAGLVVFPTFLETRPRPVSADVDMRASAVEPGLAVTGAVPRRAEPVKVLPPAVVPTDEATYPTPEAQPVPAPAPAPAPVAERAPERQPPAPASPAVTSVAKRPAVPTTTPPAVAAGSERYVVQFGAFADPKSARDARLKLERMGIKTYAQQIDTPAGKRTRVRMGPYTNRAEADKALAALRKAGLDGKVLTL